MDNNIKKIARAGYASKGTVYAITGGLALSAAIGLGQSSEGKLGVIDFLEKQAFGKVLLALMGLGLFCYSYWRFYQSVKNPENIEDNTKGTAKRVGFFLSGVVYLGLGAYALYQIFSDTGGGGGNKGDMVPRELLPYIFYAVAIGLALKSIFQLVKAFKGDFLSKFKLDTIANVSTRTIIKWLGYAGLIARGIIVGIVSYFFFTAASTATTEKVKGTKEAFSFLRQNSEGAWLIGLVAFGLICYGAYMFMMAGYRKFKG